MRSLTKVLSPPSSTDIPHKPVAIRDGLVRLSCFTMKTSLLQTGRTAFGENPELYDLARPPYPAQIMSIIERHCPVRNARIFEIGPGTGKASAMLLQKEPSELTGIEPDPRLAAYLRHLPGMNVLPCAWEDALLPHDHYDLGIAATAFHWLPQILSLQKIQQTLRPGGWWAMWWNVFGDPENPDDFHLATTDLFRSLTPQSRQDATKPFSLKTEDRTRDLLTTGFENISSHRFHWTMDMSSDQVCALAMTFPQVTRATPEKQKGILQKLTRITEEEFGGCVTRHFLTPLYLGQKPLRRKP